MKVRCLEFALWIALFVPFNSMDGQAKPTPENPTIPLVVTTNWLQTHLEDPSVAILHVGSSIREYKKGHIPGARFLWTQALALNSPDLTLELPTSSQADTVLANLGLHRGDIVVITFTNGNVPPAARAFFTLEQLGLRGRVTWLDGGFDAWKAEGRPVSREIPSVKPGSQRANLQSSGVVSADWIIEHQNDPAVRVVDARAPQVYQGNSGGMSRTGHIPGAVNIPISTLLDSTNRFRSDSVLASLFQVAGIAREDTVVTYCNIGQQASVLYLVARKLGYPALLYDGSFEDWSSRDDLPVVTEQKNH